MSGYREWQTGEVVTAANVNSYLQDQSVMKFADASARDTALGTAVGGSNALREGMASYLEDTDALQIYDGTSWATVGNAGIGTNVVSTAKTDTFSASVASGAFSADAISATITPTASNSKVLVIVSLQITVSTVGVRTRLYRAGSVSGFIGDSAGSRTRVSSGNSIQNTRGGDMHTHTYTFLDSPATTSATTYSVRLGHDSGSTQSVYMNRSVTDSDNFAYTRTASSLTLIEVAA